MTRMSAEQKARPRRRQRHIFRPSTDDTRSRLAVLEAEAVYTANSLEKAEFETERRLGILNHAHDQALEAQATFVSKEMYEAKKTEDEKWRRSVDEWIARKNGEIASVLGIIGFLTGVLALGIQLFSKFT